MTSKARTPEPKSEKVNFNSLLIEKRVQLSTVLKDSADQAATLKNGLENALNAALGERRNALFKLREAAEARRRLCRNSYDLIKAAAQKEYEEALAAAAKKHDDLIEGAHKAKEEAYRRIGSELDATSAPHVESHRALMKSLTEKYEQDELLRREAVEKTVNALLEEIKDLEEEITARRQRAEEANRNRP